VVTPRVEASADRSDFTKLGETIAASLVQTQEHANHASVLLEQTKKFADDIRSQVAEKSRERAELNERPCWLGHDKDAAPYAFDLLQHDDADLRDLPLIERKRLAKLLGRAKRVQSCVPYGVVRIVSRGWTRRIAADHQGRGSSRKTGRAWRCGVYLIEKPVKAAPHDNSPLRTNCVILTPR